MTTDLVTTIAGSVSGVLAAVLAAAIRPHFVRSAQRKTASSVDRERDAYKLGMNAAKEAEQTIRFAEEALRELSETDKLVSLKLHRAQLNGVPLRRTGHRRVGRPGAGIRLASALLPDRIAQEYLDEARDHLAGLVEEGSSTRRERYSLVVGAAKMMPRMWWGEMIRELAKRRRA